MSEPYQGPTALVTGAAQRTGRTIAEALASDGYNVLVHYHTSGAQAEELAGTLRGLGVRSDALPADLGLPDGAATLIRQVCKLTPRLDLLVNNIGNYPLGPPLAQPAQAFRDTLETNLVAPYLLIQGLRKLLAAAPTGNVVNIGYVGVDHAVANRHAMSYQISKTGLLILTKTLAQELGPAGIRVNMVSPGHLDNSVDLPGELRAHVPLGRAGTPAEIAAAIRYLVTDGSYANGANLELGGGYRLALASRLEE